MERSGERELPEADAPPTDRPSTRQPLGALQAVVGGACRPGAALRNKEGFQRSQCTCLQGGKLADEGRRRCQAGGGADTLPHCQTAPPPHPLPSSFTPMRPPAVTPDT